jgi:hydroxymethylglutaryl-CoA reductase (NADPH)
MPEIPIIPGRGLIIPSAIKARQDFLISREFKIDKIADCNIDPAEIQKNIESFVGTVEIPVGIVGPLLFNHSKKNELVYTLAGTLEGAMVASMNRGARAISLSNGFSAQVHRQKMVRAPLFIFSNTVSPIKFREWISSNFKPIKQEAEKHSNHAKLISIDVIVVDKTAHVKFGYTTGDASGQNMTTTCTWHAMLWIAQNFQSQTRIDIEKFIIEGNGSSDKKVSRYNIEMGRGMSVTAKCTITEENLEKVLRTTADDMLVYFDSSNQLAEIDGMVGYNINIANAIAAIFVATGQDLASIHESSVGILKLKKSAAGLDVSLNMPSLVIGTVGGGTHIARQKQALELMGCYGSGKIERFACLIAGFAISLELSTYAAIVSGAFAKAHEKLGRNKPVDWLLKSEITKEFLERSLLKNEGMQLSSVEIEKSQLVENGIITEITGKTCNKLIGFIPVTLSFTDGLKTVEEQIILKSKALDIEVIKGLHALAANIDTGLSDLLSVYKENLEYWNCHLKELKIYEQLHQTKLNFTPEYRGKYTDNKREIYLLFLERLLPGNIEHINTQKTPQVWTKQQILSVIAAITNIHRYFENADIQQNLPEIQEFKPWKSKPLYQKFISLMVMDSEGKKETKRLADFLENMETEHDRIKLPKTIIHNDFNSRNIAIRKSKSETKQEISPCIYDWELAVINFPHRDIVEFLSFVLIENFETETFLEYLHFHHSQFNSAKKYCFEEWKKGYVYALKEFLVTRVSYYEVAGILAKYAFSERVMKNSFRMLEILESKVV